MRKRNKFSLSHYRLLTGDMGYLIPMTWFEVLPGDTIQHRTAALVRCTPMLKPIMHPCAVRIHHWYVPNRLIWDDWESFITGGEDGADSSTHPYITVASVTEGSLHDYLGAPAETYNANLNALPFRAYNLIYNEHYRDQDLVTAATIDTTDGADTTTGTSLHRVAWSKDYFTTARPWEYKGSTVTVPLGDDAPVTGFGRGSSTSWNSGPINAYETDGTGAESYASYKDTSGANNMYVEEDPNNSGYPNIRTDLSSAGVDINDFRLALALQKYQERVGRHGARFGEYLRELGIRSSDARLQNPEYLGGGRQVVQFSEVLSTDGSNTGDPKGHGISAMRSNRYRRFFEEHGIVMTLMSVVPKPIYADALYRHWMRETKEDYYQSELVHLGEQPITNQEAMAHHSTPAGTFGYQARYNEYRYMPSGVSGEFRSTENDWHLAREYSGDISLNQSFADCNPTKRVFASSSTDCLYVMGNHSIQARRMLPSYSVPKIIG
jgi:hypothetical protein